MTTNEIACKTCECRQVCATKCKTNSAWQTVMDVVYRNKIAKRLCGNYIAITAPYMIDETEDDEA